MINWRQWLRLYAAGFVAVASFAMGLILIFSYRVGSLNHPISGYFYGYGNGWDTAIVLLGLIFLIAFVTIRFANKFDAKAKALVDIGYDVKFVELIHLNQTVISVLITLTFLAIILDICVSG